MLAGTDAPGATDPSPAGESQPPASPTGTTPPGGRRVPRGSDDDEPLRDDSEITAARLERRFKRLTAARRQAERERDALAQQHQVELAQTRGQLEAVQRMLQGRRARTAADARAADWPAASRAVRQSRRLRAGGSPLRGAARVAGSAISRPCSSASRSSRCAFSGT